ncbi:MAG TPA: hypothetical protein VMB26_03100 [Candidatus Binataceae bacterium]|nr:hypothetical protein [Candidatus Binataceae bacterium]
MYESELKLYRAVMLQAAQDIADSNQSRRDGNRIGNDSVRALQSHHSALRWITDDADYPFSFRNCCQVLGVDFRRARRHLIRLSSFEVTGRREFFSAAMQGWAA